MGRDEHEGVDGHAVEALGFADDAKNDLGQLGRGFEEQPAWMVRVVTSTSEPAGTKRSGLGMHSCRQRRARVACVQPTFTSLPRPRLPHF